MYRTTVFTHDAPSNQPRNADGTFRKRRYNEPKVPLLRDCNGRFRRWYPGEHAERVNLSDHHIEAA